MSDEEIPWYRNGCLLTCLSGLGLLIAIWLLTTWQRIQEANKPVAAIDVYGRLDVTDAGEFSIHIDVPHAFPGIL